MISTQFNLYDFRIGINWDRIRQALSISIPFVTVIIESKYKKVVIPIAKVGTPNRNGQTLTNLDLHRVAAEAAFAATDYDNAMDQIFQDVYKRARQHKEGDNVSNR